MEVDNDIVYSLFFFTSIEKENRLGRTGVSMRGWTDCLAPINQKQGLVVAAVCVGHVCIYII